MQRRNSSDYRARRVLLRFATAGSELAAAVIGLTLLGWWFDRGFNTSPVGLLAGAGLGIVGGMYNFLRDAWRFRQEDDAKDQDKRPQDRDEDGPQV
jgi:F0F1-type ATP synthase assembly protein I